MGLSDDVFGLSSGINNEISEINEKIRRLKSAQSSIESEQEAGYSERIKYSQPHLLNYWTGQVADEFDAKREEVREEWTSIIDREFNQYIDRITLEINVLERRRSNLEWQLSALGAVNDLIDQGEDFLDAAADKLSEVKGLFR